MVSKEREWKDHKYITKVPIGKRFGKTVYRYFYDKKEYQDYLKKKKVTEIVKANEKSTNMLFSSKAKIPQVDTLSKVESPLKTGIEAVQKLADRTVSSIEKQDIDIGKQVLGKSSSPFNATVTTNPMIGVKLIELLTSPFKPKIEDEHILDLPVQKWRTNISSIDSLSDLEKVNPNYSTGKYEWTHNCGYCTAAYDLRRRGYDVEAKPRDRDYPVHTSTIASWYIDTSESDFRTMQEVVYDAEGLELPDMTDAELCDFMDINEEAVIALFEKEIVAQGEGSYGHLCIDWRDGGAHDVAYEVSDGRVILMEAQANTLYTLSEIAPYICDIDYLRTDNREPSDEILKVVRARKKESKK